MLNRWLRTMFSPWGKVVMASITASMAMLSVLPQGTRAEVPKLDINLLGFGSVPWSIDYIKPGDSGSQAITLRNVGSEAGQVVVWLSNVVVQKTLSRDSKLWGEPAIDKYLTLKLTGAGVNSGPVTIRDFGKNATSANAIQVGRLGAGESANLEWEWNLPAQTGNDAQGDLVSFDINYMIETPPEPVVKPPAATAPVRSIQVVLPGMKVVERLGGNGETTAQAVRVTSSEAPISLAFDANTKIVNTRTKEMQGDSDVPLDEVPHRIEATIMTQEEEAAAGIEFPEGWRLVSDVWEIVGYTYDVPHHVTVEAPAQIVIGYDQGLLPADTEAIGLFYYNEDTREWSQLEDVPGYIAAEGEVAAQVGHFSIFAVLAKGADEGGGTGTGTGTEPGTIEPGGGTEEVVPKAKFVIENLVVNPPQIKVGEYSTITATVTNVGAVRGEYRATLLLDGEPVAGKNLTLGPGESQEVTFTVSPRLPGAYSIDVNELGGELDVISLPSLLDYRKPVYWWIVLAAAGLVILLITMVKVGSTAPAQFAVGVGGRAAARGAAVAPALSMKEVFIVPQMPCIGEGTSLQLRAFARMSDNSERDITEKADWTSAKPGTAEVNNEDFKGLVFGLAPGAAAVVVRWSGRDARALVGVNCSILAAPEEAGAPAAAGKAVQAVILQPKSPAMEVGDSLQFKATASYEDGSMENVTERAAWASTNDYVADVDADGTAKAYSPGMTAIIVTFRGKRGSTSLLVQPPSEDEE